MLLLDVPNLAVEYAHYIGSRSVQVQNGILSMMHARGIGFSFMRENGRFREGVGKGIQQQNVFQLKTPPRCIIVYLRMSSIL